MPKLPCRCGYVHDRTPIPDDGFQVLPDWATDKLLYTQETRPERWEVEELRQTALSRLYLCPNCETIMWDRAGDGHFHMYQPNRRLIRIFADLDDRDPLGGVWLRHPRTVTDIQTQRLLARPGLWVVVHNDREELYAELHYALDDTGAPMPDVLVARPVDQDEAARLLAEGA
jgi:hypothetical protein